jgi:hypothetical protein
LCFGWNSSSRGASERRPSLLSAVDVFSLMEATSDCREVIMAFMFRIS